MNAKILKHSIEIGEEILENACSLKSFCSGSPVVQFHEAYDNNNKHWLKIKSKFDEVLKSVVGDIPYFEPCLLFFKSVEPHIDDECPILYNKKRKIPLYIHLVLCGSAMLHVGKDKIEFNKGNLFVMNPKRKHYVISDTECITVCATIPNIF